MEDILFCDICENKTIITNTVLGSSYILSNSNDVEKKNDDNDYKIVCKLCKVHKYPKHKTVLYKFEKKNNTILNNPLINQRLFTIDFFCLNCKENRRGKMFVVSDGSLEQNIICSSCKNIFLFEDKK